MLASLHRRCDTLLLTPSRLTDAQLRVLVKPVSRLAVKML